MESFKTIFVLLVLFFSANSFAQFTPGNIVVVRIGDGTGLSSSACPVFLDEYTTSGTLVQSFALPTALSGSNKRLVNSGTASSEGSLTLSSDGRYLVLAGYDADVGITTVSSTSADAVNRVVGMVDLFGTINTTTALTDAFSSISIRSAATNDGSQFWISGAAAGRYTTIGTTTSISISTAPSSTRVFSIFNNQLYVSSASSTFQGISSVGTGLPTTTGQTTTILPGFPTATGPSSYGFSINAAGTVIYLADDRSAETGGGIQKLTSSGGTWTLVTTFNNGGATNVRYLTVDWSGTNPIIYAATTETSANKIIKFVDDGGTTFSTLYTSAESTVFRGIAFAPNSATIISGSPSLKAGTYNNITLNGANLSLSGDATINDVLTLTSGLLTLGSNNLTLGSSATISGTPSAANMIVATGSGELRKALSDGTTPVSFTFPVGDNTSTSEYSPVTLNFTSGSFLSAYAGVNLVNGKHTNNTSATDFLNRYWTVTSSGITSFSCSVTCQYLPADVAGTEANIYCGKLDGSTWTLFAKADAVNHRLTGTVSGFSTFTGGQQSAMPVTLASFNSSIIGRRIKLSWVTGSEQNNSGFNVERKTVSGAWGKVGYVQGRGTANTPSRYSFEDRNLQTGKYNYRLKQIDNNGNFEYHNLSSIVEIGVPNKFDLSQNYPNPFNPATKINFDLPADSKVNLLIYDVTGREVAKLLNNEFRAAGYHTAEFNASKFASGVYFYSFSTETFRITKRMMLVK